MFQCWVWFGTASNVNVLLILWSEFLWWRCGVDKTCLRVVKLMHSRMRQDCATMRNCCVSNSCIYFTRNDSRSRNTILPISYIYIYTYINVLLNYAWTRPITVDTSLIDEVFVVSAQYVMGHFELGNLQTLLWSGICLLTTSSPYRGGTWDNCRI